MNSIGVTAIDDGIYEGNQPFVVSLNSVTRIPEQRVIFESISISIVNNAG